MESMEWFSFRAGCDGTVWTVYLVDKVPTAGTPYRRGDLLHGLTDFTARSVLIRAADDEEEQNETVLHELMRVSYGPTRGLRQYRAHEHQVHTMSPALYATLRHLRAIRWPRRPNGWRSLITEE